MHFNGPSGIVVPLFALKNLKLSRDQADLLQYFSALPVAAPESYYSGNF